MSRRYSGNFRAKHPADTKVDDFIMNQVTSNMVEGRITCQKAHTIATALAVPPGRVGVAIDLQNGRINACQLGLFGYGKIKRIAQGGPDPKADLKSAIENNLNNGRLSCVAAWSIADALGVPRQEVGRACEILGIKIKQCQLGAF